MPSNHYPPESSQVERGSKLNPALEIYGRRIHLDQTLYEYTLEFLLVFASAKTADGAGALAFHTGSPVQYYVQPRNGFRRFVFYEHARKSVKIKEDEDAYLLLRRILKEHIRGVDSDGKREEFVDAIQDLFRGYSAVLKKRSWCAQSLLPLCPEMILCEEMPNTQQRMQRGMNDLRNRLPEGYDLHNTYHDTCFDCNRHNFFARGGELYYLHLLQVLEEDDAARQDLERKLRHLLTAKSGHFSQLAQWIQELWVSEAQIWPEALQEKMPMGCIPAGAYREAGAFAVQELRCFLSNDLHPVKRIELLMQGVMLQLLRMMRDRACEYTEREKTPWIVDMRGTKSDPTIRQLSMQSYQRLNEIFTDAINRNLAQRYSGQDSLLTDERYKAFVMARKESVDLFRARGKDLKLIIPAKGSYERFSVSEDIARFLVLSLIRPGEKMDLDSFLEEVYRHYRMVIGPAEYQHSLSDAGMSKALSNSFTNNRTAFQEFLKSIGCLRALSDATSIVVNPYQEVELS